MNLITFPSEFKTTGSEVSERTERTGEAGSSVTLLKISTLSALYNDLTAKNAAVLAATVPLSNARISRNEILYKEKTGLVDTAFDVKVYIKSLFGATSSQYKQISKLKFVAKKD